MLDRTIAGQHVRVVIGTLTPQYVEVVKACRVGAEMPLANNRCLVTSSAQQFGHVLLLAVEPIAVARESVQVAVLSGQDRRSRRPANRIRDETPVEPHAVLSNPIQIRRLIALAAVAAKCLVTVVVRHDEQDVRTVSCAERLRYCQCNQRRQKQTHDEPASRIWS